MLDSPGIRFRSNLEIGSAELLFAQGEATARHREIVRALTRRPGLVVEVQGSGRLGAAWRVEDIAGTGTLQFRTIQNDPDSVLSLVSSDYDAVNMTAADAELPAVPDDATWYTLVARVVATDYEPGDLALTGGVATVIGTGTRFTRYLPRDGGANLYGLRLRIASGDTAHAGNVGDYEVETVVSDTELTLRTSPTDTETGVRFTVTGRWYGTPPAEVDVSRRLRVELELVARTRTPAAGDLVLADVMRDTGTSAAVQIIDRRFANLHSLRSVAEGVVAHMMVSYNAAGDPSGTVDTLYTGISGAIGGYPWVVPHHYGKKSAGVGYLYTAGAAVKWAYQAASTGLRPGFAGLAFTKVTVYANGSDPCGLQPGHPDGRLLAWCVVGGNTVIQLDSTDNGATWSAGSAIWDATAQDPADTMAQLSVMQHSNGRIYLSASYTDDSLGDVHGRCVYSDDYGDTWQINGDAGFIFRSNDAYYPRLCEAPDGSIWYCYIWDPDETTALASTIVYRLDGIEPSTWSPAADYALNMPSSAGNPGAFDLYAPKFATPMWIGETFILAGAVQLTAGVSVAGVLTCALDLDGGRLLPMGLHLLATMASTRPNTIAHFAVGPSGALHGVWRHPDTYDNVKTLTAHLTAAPRRGEVSQAFYSS